jgi:hypothetical protein
MAEDSTNGPPTVAAPPAPEVKQPRKKASPRRKAVANAKSNAAEPAKKKGGAAVRPYPVVPFRDATAIADAIFKFASGEKVRRLTLLEKMERNPNSSATRMLITNSSKYGITTGSYSAEYFELNPTGRLACNPEADRATRLKAQFQLALEGIEPFKLLYDTYVGKKLPAHEVMKDRLVEGGLVLDNPKECIDLFIVNVKDLGLLRNIASAETLVPIEQALEEVGAGRETPALTIAPGVPATDHATRKAGAPKWETTCFYISPIGEPGSDPRKHSDLFLSIIVEPALKELGLEVVRADKIAEPGMITSHILEHIKKSRLVVADLVLLNPNVFYEMALRHAVKLPIVQIIRKADRLPFDVNQVNSVIIDNTDIYTFTPAIETYRSEITTLARRALEDPEHVGNPISVFFPDFWK